MRSLPSSERSLRFGLQRSQWVLASILLATLIGLVYNSVHTAERRAADAAFRLTTETSNSNIVYTQRESTNYALKVERWLGQGATRREVQIARAFLEQRLRVKDATGVDSYSATTDEYRAALDDLDRAVAQQPSGYLADSVHEQVRQRLEPVLDAFNTQSRTLLTTYQQQADDRYRAFEVARAASDRNNAILLTAFFLGFLGFSSWVFTTTSRSFRAARQRITTDSQALEAARSELVRAAALERGQAEILERIAKGSALPIVFRKIVALAHDLGRTHVHIVTSEGIHACCATDVSGETWSATFGHTPTGEDAGNVILFGDGEQIVDEQIRLARRCADLAAIAVDRVVTEEQLKQKASHDPLTGVANRTLLMTRLESALHRTSRTGHLAVLFCDLDRFKQVNDTLGHEAGDQLLREVAQRLQSVVRASDTVARLGGDEFVVVCEGVSGPEWAEELASRVQQALAQVYVLGSAEVFIDASIGIAHVTPHTRTTAAEVLRHADAAMYKAKSSTTRRWFSYDDTVPPRPTIGQQRRASDVLYTTNN